MGEFLSANVCFQAWKNSITCSVCSFFFTLLCIVFLWCCSLLVMCLQCSTFLWGKKKLLLHGVKQFYICWPDGGESWWPEGGSWKFEVLSELYKTLTINQSVIYCNTKRKVEWLTDNMRQRDFFGTVAATHREMDPKVFN